MIDNRDLIIKAAQKHPEGSLEAKIREAIPFEVPKTVNGPNLGAMVVAIHTAMNPLMTKMRYPSHELVGSFKMIDNAIKTAISNFQADHPAKQSNCFPTLKQSDKN